MKTYVLTLSQTFPSYHPHRGQQTDFKLKLYQKEKIHTIRGNYKFWEKRFAEIAAGRAKLSVREWLDKPYYSKQNIVKEFTSLQGIGIQKCDVHITNNNLIGVKINKSYLPGLTVMRLIENDGLTPDDFKSWFKKPIIDGVIIHFSDFRY